MVVDLDTALSSIITQKRRVSALRKLGMQTVRDALTNYPFRVTAPMPLLRLGQMTVGMQAAAYVHVVRCRVTPVYGRGGSRIEALVEDMPIDAIPIDAMSIDTTPTDTLSIDAMPQTFTEQPQSRRSFAVSARAQLVFFSRNRGFSEWMSSKLQEGTELVIAGTPSVFNGGLQFTHPEVIVTHYPGLSEELGFDGDFGAASSQVRAANAGHTGHTQSTGHKPRSKESATPVAQAIESVTRPRPVYHANSSISKEHVHETIVNILKLLAQQSPTYGQEVSGTSGSVDTASTANTANTQSALNTAASTANTQSTENVALPEAPLRAADLAYIVPDIIPEDVRVRGEYMHRAEAYLAVHCPQTVQEYELGKRTLRFEEAFISQTALLSVRQKVQQDTSYVCVDGQTMPFGSELNHKEDNTSANGGNEESAPQRSHLVEEFIDSLPFTPTHGQQRVIDDIVHDMSQTYPMQRLLQGEVGSGKTVVAVAAMLQAVGAGYQAVLVAPTQVLAEQHVQSIQRMIATMQQTHADVDIPVVLLTGSLKLKERRQVLAQAASGEPCIIVATHAAFSKSFQAPRLALAVIDEQHRFGVQQREALRNLNDISPHMLVMTATPIPRTAAMTWFGDLDISWLTELPGGRKPITTVLVHEDDGRTMQRMFQHIRDRIDAGERAYIVCPRIDADTDADSDADTHSNASTATSRASETSEPTSLFDQLDPYRNSDDYGAEMADETSKRPMHSVMEIAARLQSLQQFQGIQFGILTGRDDDETKQRVMQEFADGTAPILVATTVIEVGVDVPQASCIVIFDADHFGLSQLHQLRGRVGRGGTKSWAFLVSHADADSPAAQRLQVIKDSTDGAEIAQEDLRLRGEGDVLGDTQAGGRSSFKLLRVVADADIIQQARAEAAAVLESDATLSAQQYTQLAGAVLDFMRGNEQYLTSN